MYALLIGIFAFTTLSTTQAYFITLAPNNEECYFDRVAKNTPMTLLFEVSEGGSLDVDVKVFNPEGKEIYFGKSESDGKFTFKANTEGIYRYCFSNGMSTMTPKVIMFTLFSSEPPISEKGADNDKDHHTQLETMIKDLSNSLSTVKHEQEYMEVRERIHKHINDNTNSRVVMWSFFEAGLLLMMTIGQVYYLKRFFEVRRIV